VEQCPPVHPGNTISCQHTGFFGVDVAGWRPWRRSAANTCPVCVGWRDIDFHGTASCGRETYSRQTNRSGFFSDLNPKTSVQSPTIQFSCQFRIRMARFINQIQPGEYRSDHRQLFRAAGVPEMSRRGPSPPEDSIWHALGSRSVGLGIRQASVWIIYGNPHRGRSGVQRGYRLSQATWGKNAGNPKRRAS